jgi:RNA polymerase sigma-70 factor (ECF subfamily)
MARIDGLAEAYDRYAAPIYRFLCGFLGNREDAEDALQNLFAKLARVGIDHVEDLRTYLWTGARNEARALARRPPAPYLLPRNGHPVSAADREAAEQRLAALPDEQREVVVLHVLEGWTFDEVASALGIPPDTAASRFRYAREKLKEIL